MLLIRCTRKVRQEMGLGTKKIAEPIATPADALAEWYADLVKVGSKKIIVFTHASTLFTFVALDVRRQDIQALAELFLAQLQVVLTHLDGSQTALKTIACLRSGCLYAPTADRRVLGSMNDLIRALKLYIDRNGGVGSSDAIGLSLWLSQTLLSAIGYDQPIERFRALLRELGL